MIAVVDDSDKFVLIKTNIKQNIYLLLLSNFCLIINIFIGLSTAATPLFFFYLAICTLRFEALMVRINCTKPSYFKQGSAKLDSGLVSVSLNSVNQRVVG